MTLVTSKEFIADEDKYFDLALNGGVCIQRGDFMYHLVSSRPAEKKAQVCDNSKPRQGWAKQSKEFVETGNEETFFPDFFKDEDLNWWQWEQK